MSEIKRIGVLTGGGDAPGLNAVIRAVVKSACNDGCECLGIEDSFGGLLRPDGVRRLTPSDATGILRQGGTILGTSNRGDPFLGVDTDLDGTPDLAEQAMARFHELGLDGLVAIGGDGTLAIAHEFYQRGIPLVGVPKTIDNDIVGTNSTFGFDTAVGFASEALDRLHSTAAAHQRLMVVEVMGRNAGWIALYAGVSGGADVILIPEIPYRLERVAASLEERERLGAKFSIIVVAEGAVPEGGEASVIEPAGDGRLARFGGLGSLVAAGLEELTGKEARSVRLGHLLRGGSPSSFDRVLATRFGGRAVELLRDGAFGQMVANRPPDIVSIPLADVVGRTKQVPLDLDLIRTARAIGVAFGD